MGQGPGDCPDDRARRHVAGVVGPAVDPFDGDGDGHRQAQRTGFRPLLGDAAVKATAAAVCPDGNDEESGRSSTSSAWNHSFGGRSRGTSRFPTPLDSTSATAIPVRPAAAARRPRYPR